MGYEDYFYSGNLCLLEWLELIEDILPEDVTKVKRLQTGRRNKTCGILETVNAKHLDNNR